MLRMNFQSRVGEANESYIYKIREESRRRWTGPEGRVPHRRTEKSRSSKAANNAGYWGKKEFFPGHKKRVSSIRESEQSPSNW